VNGVSVALDETAREVSERQVLPAGGLRERIEQQRPITAYVHDTPSQRLSQNPWNARNAGDQGVESPSVSS
jgi:tetraacyldisaccharide-1-P 4'-kinase